MRVYNVQRVITVIRSRRGKVNLSFTVACGWLNNGIIRANNYRWCNVLNHYLKRAGSLIVGCVRCSDVNQCSTSGEQVSRQIIRNYQQVRVTGILECRRSPGNCCLAIGVCVCHNRPHRAASHHRCSYVGNGYISHTGAGITGLICDGVNQNGWRACIENSGIRIDGNIRDSATIVGCRRRQWYKIRLTTIGCSRQNRICRALFRMEMLF